MKNRKRILFCILVGSVIIFSCSKNKDEEKNEGDVINKENLNSAGIKEEGKEFTVEYVKPRRIFKIEKEDLNNDGVKEIIILSVAKDSNEKYNDYYNFDMIEIFSLDSVKDKYTKIISDTVDYSKEIIFVDLENNNMKQILINTNFGGNEDIVSRGMFIYTMRSGNEVNLLRYFDTGAPEIADIRNDGKKEIIVSDIFYGVMPQKNAISFVKDIYKMENQKLVTNNIEFTEFYDEKIDTLLEKYYGVKRKVEMGMQMMDMAYPLYREAAEVMLNYYAKNDSKGLMTFWNEEKESLKRNIPQDEFLDLSNFILKAIPSSKNA